jgi:hypothetical protein
MRERRSQGKQDPPMASQVATQAVATARYVVPPRLAVAVKTAPWPTARGWAACSPNVNVRSSWLGIRGRHAVREHVLRSIIDA